MLENPTTKITLLGCNSDIGAEKNNSLLSTKRAEEVKNYLVNVWKISSDRIKLESRGLPAKASLPKDEADKIAENRRVEILSDEYEILKPVFIEKIDRTANPPIARFKQSANSEIGLKNWEVTAYQTSDPTNKYISSGTSQLLQTVDWKLDNFQKIIPKFPEPLLYSLKLTDSKGNEKFIDSKTLPIKVVTLQEKKKEMLGDYEIERFSLILFDFDKANIEGNNQKIIDFIKTRIKPNSEVEISGYTDRTGEEDYNKKLSSMRAEQTKKALGTSAAKAQGFGEEKLIYDNELPEGRFYCRTIEITVRTKKE
jgi:outer membrane protein OmpA-like peptidoglycan-associated protein